MKLILSISFSFLSKLGKGYKKSKYQKKKEKKKVGFSITNPKQKNYIAKYITW
jgi:hypothetical protein